MSADLPANQTGVKTALREKVAQGDGLDRGPADIEPRNDPQDFNWFFFHCLQSQNRAFTTEARRTRRGAFFSPFGSYRKAKMVSL
jgi:hypothetical protein